MPQGVPNQGVQKMKVIVDPKTCMSCGICVSIAPQVFHLGDEVYAEVILDPVPEHLRDVVQAAIDECPEGAIRIEE